MKTKNITTIKTQKGSMLLEGLIGILIFSLGVLSLVGLQSVAVKNVTQSKYRSDAAYLADKLIAQMWVDNQTALSTEYATGGARYRTWRDSIISAKSLPGVSTSPTRNEPAVTMTPDPTTGSVTATVTLFWQLPGETTPHRYVTVAQIGK